jgi:hypothetical protein
MRVRLFGAREAVALVKVNDVDSPHLAIDQRGGVIREVGERREGGDLSVLLPQEGASVLAGARPDTMGSLDVTLVAAIDRSRSGWRYRGNSIRVGGPVTFTTPTYSLSGLVLRLDINEDATRPLTQ